VPYLDLQLKELKPKLVCTLGRFATKHFLGDVSISEVHGKPIRTNGYVIFPLFHPAAALRSKGVERELRKDFKKIPQVLNGELAVEEANNHENEDQISLF
jgi:DNA polymerase